MKDDSQGPLSRQDDHRRRPRKVCPEIPADGHRFREDGRRFRVDGHRFRADGQNDEGEWRQGEGGVALAIARQDDAHDALARQDDHRR